jgi:hypothetical protein
MKPFNAYATLLLIDYNRILWLSEQNWRMDKQMGLDRWSHFAPFNKDTLRKELFVLGVWPRSLIRR